MPAVAPGTVDSGLRVSALSSVEGGVGPWRQPPAWFTLAPRARGCDRQGQKRRGQAVGDEGGRAPAGSPLRPFSPVAAGAARATPPSRAPRGPRPSARRRPRTSRRRRAGTSRRRRRAPPPPRRAPRDAKRPAGGRDQREQGAAEERADDPSSPDSTSSSSECGSASRCSGPPSGRDAGSSPLRARAAGSSSKPCHATVQKS